MMKNRIWQFVEFFKTSPLWWSSKEGSSWIIVCYPNMFRLMASSGYIRINQWLRKNYTEIENATWENTFNKTHKYTLQRGKQKKIANVHQNRSLPPQSAQEGHLQRKDRQEEEALRSHREHTMTRLSKKNGMSPKYVQFISNKKITLRCK